MELIIKGKLIETDIVDILKDVREECNGRYLKHISGGIGNDVKCTCPWHKSGQENNPSCYVFSNKSDDMTRYGQVHCFTCGATSSLAELVSYCLTGSTDADYGNRWIVTHYGNTFIKYLPNLKEIELDNDSKADYIDPAILNKYNQYHPYMSQRKLTPEVLSKFKVGYDDEHKAITFPVWDEHNNLVMITRRSVLNKKFDIPKFSSKPVYLLNFIKYENITTVYVVESQINALTLWSWGYPAIALIGTGSYTQYKILNSSGIRNYILCFDGDFAGQKGRERFINNIDSSCIITSKKLPAGKDVNDLSKEEFDTLPTY